MMEGQIWDDDALDAVADILGTGDVEQLAVAVRNYVFFSG